MKTWAPTLLIDKQLLKYKDNDNSLVYSLVSTKSGHARKITPAAYAMSLLQACQKEQDQWRQEAGASWEKSDLVFTDRLGGHLMHHTVYHHFKRIVTAMGTPGTRFHDLRHSYAIAAIKSGDDIKTVQGNLGHATASFTLVIYGHLTDQMKKESADRMDRLFRALRDK